MTFWIIIIGIAVVVAVLLGRAMMLPAAGTLADAAEYDLQVYRDQLAEVERDVTRGVIPAEDAERVRTEISRRILSADAARGTAATSGTAPSRGLLVVMALALVGGSLALYQWIGAPGYGDLALQDRIEFAEELRENRPTQQVAVDSLPPSPQMGEVSEEFETLMARLRETVAGRPEDVQGHALLAQNEARLGNFTAAAKAQETVLRLKAEDVLATDVADFGELLVMAAGGYVSPEAEVALSSAALES